MADVHIALLRGLNVGGKNKLPMAALAALFADAGCTDVRTYIQSGNVLFTAAPALAKRVPAAVAEAIQKGFGLRTPVVLRSAGELRAVPGRNPFKTTDGIHVAFLSSAPTAAQVAALDPQRSPGDTFAVVGREVYLNLPNGVGRTKLTNDYFDRGLSTVSTLRNWNTLTKLIGLAG